jgi:hypothetical protein
MEKSGAQVAIHVNSNRELVYVMTIWDSRCSPTLLMDPEFEVRYTEYLKDFNRRPWRDNDPLAARQNTTDENHTPYQGNCK